MSSKGETAGGRVAALMSLSSLPEITVQVNISTEKVHAESSIGFEPDHVTFTLSEMFVFTSDKY